MENDLVSGITTPYFSQGILGVSCVVLALVILRLWNELKGERQAHKVELAAKDALINNLYEARITEAKVVVDVLKSNEKTQDAFLAAINGRSHT